MDNKENIEFDLLLNAIRKIYGYDFRNYAQASLKRRINDFMNQNGFSSFGSMISPLIENKVLFKSFFFNITVTYTEMFRDPDFYINLKKLIIPYLKQLPFFKIWHVGCSTGEEVFSLAIVLKEEKILERATIYATDYNDFVLKKAKTGLIQTNNLHLYERNYAETKPKAPLSNYYNTIYNMIYLKPEILKKITFGNHNLVTDSVFGEMNLILCRNVLIYFNSQLQHKVFLLLTDSLEKNGYLCLGTKEMIVDPELKKHYHLINERNKIYQKSS